MLTFLEKQIDELVESLPYLLKATLGLLVGTGVLFVLVLRVGFLAYIVGMWVTAVIGGICHFRIQLRPFGMGLLASASVMLSALPLFLFGAIFRSMG